MAGCCQEARGKEDNLNRYKGSESSRDRKKKFEMFYLSWNKNELCCHLQTTEKEI